jgi:hypothetical protein
VDDQFGTHTSNKATFSSCPPPPSPDPHPAEAHPVLGVLLMLKAIIELFFFAACE